MSENKTILIVDDSPQQIDMMSQVLSDKYNVLVALNGEDTLEIFEQAEEGNSGLPEMILLDIRMDGMDGYEVCRRLRAHSLGADIPVIFVSAADTLEERLAGYEVGGNDYITKPFSADELLTKVDLMFQYRAKQGELQGQASMAMSTAMEAMTNASELGVVLNFMRDSFQVNSFGELAQLMVNAMLNYNLKCMVEIRDKNGSPMHRSFDGAVSPLEVEVIDKLKTGDRIFDFGQRTVISYPHVSILIKNMPLDEPERYGRIKDNGALLVEGAEERIKALIIQDEVRKQHDELSDLLSSTEESLKTIELQQSTNKRVNAQLTEDLIHNVEHSFTYLGLSEQQEEDLLELVSKSVKEIHSSYEKGSEIDECMKQVVNGLSQAINKLEL